MLFNVSICWIRKFQETFFTLNFLSSALKTLVNISHICFIVCGALKNDKWSSKMQQPYPSFIPVHIPKSCDFLPSKEQPHSLSYMITQYAMQIIFLIFRYVRAMLLWYFNVLILKVFKINKRWSHGENARAKNAR